MCIYIHIFVLFNFLFQKKGKKMRQIYKKNRTRLIKAALGKEKCDLTIGNIKFFNVFTGEIYPAEVDVLDGIVVCVRETPVKNGMPSDVFFDGEGCYLIPGFIDTHMHVESTMMIPENLSRAIVPWGTTTVCTDPHEIGNVMGKEGVRFMLENAKKSLLRQYILAPSCVPSVPDLESSGACFGADEIAELLDTDGIIGIAELMDFVGVCNDSSRMHAIIDEGIKRGVFLQGHAPGVSGRELAAYLQGGPVSDHESRSAAEVSEKLRNGMHVNLRASSLVDDLTDLIGGLKHDSWNDFVSICTDDVHAKDLLTSGHVNRVVRKAIQAGMDPKEVIKFATLNAAREYQFNDLGAIAPGYIADMQLVRQLDGNMPFAVFVSGKLAAKNGVYLGSDVQATGQAFPNTVNIPQIQSSQDFLLRVPEEKCNDDFVSLLIVARGERNGIRQFEETVLPLKDRCVNISDYPDFQFVSVINRYGTGGKTIAVFRDFGITEGAFASTISHDCHNLTVVYRDPECAYVAAKELEKCGGGICVVDANHNIALLPLPVAGLMSFKPCREIALLIEKEQQALDAICNKKLSLLAAAIISLAAVPGAVITDKGLVDGLSQRIISQFC
jgi:adenine deaminase